MAQSVLTAKGTVITRQTLRKLQWDELNSPIEKDKRNRFNSFILKKLGDSNTIPKKIHPRNFIPYHDNEDESNPPRLPNDEDSVAFDGIAAF